MAEATWTDVKVKAPNGLEIDGTLEVVHGRALCNFYRDEAGKLVYDYAGETEMFWDEQETVCDSKGNTIYLDTDGNQWTEKELTITKGEDDRDCPNCIDGVHYSDPAVAEQHRKDSDSAKEPAS